MKRFLLTIYCMLATCAAFAQVQLNPSLSNRESTYAELYDFDEQVLAFMEDNALQGVSLSVGRGDSRLFSRGYGWADREAGKLMEPGTLMRVASVSKLVTAVGIMKLVENGSLSLSDKVFGPDGILSDSLYTKSIRDSLYFQITVENLLRHEGGFDDSSGDPMFLNEVLSRKYSLPSNPDAKTRVRGVIRDPLRFYPGSSQDYSNFGYLLLSMIIEEVTGENYEQWMQKNILRPAGCYDFRVAENYYNRKFPTEAHYYQASWTVSRKEKTPSVKRVEPIPYTSDIKCLSGGGAWVASSAEVARFVSAINGLPGVKDILSRSSIERMTEYYDEHTFPLGWIAVTSSGEWIRTGSLTGTSALIKRYPDGECWVLITNTSTPARSRFTRLSRALCDSLRNEFGYILPEKNLFEQPR